MGFSLVISDFKFNSARSDKIGYTGVNSPKFVEIISETFRVVIGLWKKSNSLF